MACLIPLQRTYVPGRILTFTNEVLEIWPILEIQIQCVNQSERKHKKLRRTHKIRWQGLGQILEAFTEPKEAGKVS